MADKTLIPEHLQIERDIPIAYNQKYPFAKLKVGESFTVSAHLRNSCAASAVYFSKKNGTRFRFRKVNKEVSRVWRIK